MGTDVSTAGQQFRGLLIPDPRLGWPSFDAALSTYTEATPLPGVPEDLGDSSAVLESGGVQGQNVDLRIKGQSAGAPVPDGGSFVWRNAADAVTEHRGWDPPQAITDFAILDYTTTGAKWQGPHAIRLQNDSVGVVVLSSGRYIRFWSKSYNSRAWTEVAVADPNGGTYALAETPTIAQLPSGRILIVAWVEYAGIGNQVNTYYSDDNGTTWALASKNALTAVLDTAVYHPQRTRCAYLNGQLLLLSHVKVISGGQTRDVIAQWGSSDLGASFVLVALTGFDVGVGGSISALPGGSGIRGYMDIIVTGGQFCVVYLACVDPAGWGTTAAILPVRAFLGNAFDALGGAVEAIATQAANPQEWGTKAADNFTGGELAAWADEDGVLYLSGSDFNAGGGALREFYTNRSIDGGDAWTGIGTGSAPGFGAAWWNGQDAAKHPKDITGCAQGGRSVVLHEFASDTDNHDDSLCATFLGGYTSVPLPNRTGYLLAANNRCAFERTWLPIALPDAMGYTLTTGGAPVIALANSALQITGGAGDSVSYARTVAPPGTMPRGIYALVEGWAQTTTVGGGFFATLQIGDGAAHGYQIRVVASNQKVILRDMIAGADLTTAPAGSAACIAANAGIQILVCLANESAVPANNGRVRMWWRPTTGTNDTDHHWTEFGALVSTLQDTGIATANALSWGVLNGVATSCRMKMLNWSSDTYTGEQLWGLANSADLLGRNFSSEVAGYVDSGTRMRMVAGPIYRGDGFKIATRSPYRIENVHSDVAPSYRRGWRSVSNAAQVELVWSVDNVLDQNTHILGGTLGLYLGEVNFPTSELWGLVKGTGYVKLADIDTAVGQKGLCFTRRGDAFVPNTAGAGTPASEWFTFGVLKDCTAKVNDGVGAIVYRKITYNSEGIWRQNLGTDKYPTILVSGALSTDPTGGAPATLDIWGKDVFVLVNDASIYTKFKLVIPAQNTAEGDFRIGIREIGHVAFLSRRYSRGRALGADSNYELSEQRSGTRIVRDQGPARRTVEFAWLEGVDVSQVTAAAPSPNFITAYAGSTKAVGSPADTLYLVAGLAQMLRGAKTPIVYLPNIVRGTTSATVTTVNRHKMLRARLMTDPRMENILGNEWGIGGAGELFQMATIKLEEEL